jgi:hypothetical protein
METSRREGKKKEGKPEEDEFGFYPMAEDVLLKPL